MPERLGLSNHVVAGHDGAARVGPQQGREDPHGGGLAGPVRPEEAEHRLGLHLEVDAVDGLDLPVPLLQALDEDRRCIRHPVAL